MTRFKLPLGRRTLLMGVLNVTPDSFSDGGDFRRPQAAVAHARRMRREGADLIDIGGESTRPGSKGVRPQTELDRVTPVVKRLAKDPGLVLSIDTTKEEVARACLALGARVVNDVSACRLEPRVADAAREFDAYLVLMHMQGTPRDMQEAPSYDDVVADVCGFLRARAAWARRRGVPKDRIIIDPGIGFGKTLEHNLELLACVADLKALGYPVLVGASRKSLFKGLLGLADPKGRDAPTAALTTYLASQGVDIVRVHEVPRNLEAARLGDGLRRRA